MGVGGETDRGAPRTNRRLRALLGVALAGLVTAIVLISATAPATKVVAALPAAGRSAPGPGSHTGSGATRRRERRARRRRIEPPWKGTGVHCGLTLDPTRARPVDDCTVLEIGDSLGSDLGWGLDRHVTAACGLHFVQEDVPSTGLANPSFYDWPAHLAADLAQYHPQLVIVSLGGNDQQGLLAGGSAVQFPAPAWRQAYLARVRSIVEEATRARAYVLWVGMPIMQQPGFSAGMQILDSLYRQAVAGDPDAVFLPVWSLFAGPQGQFESSAVVNGSSTAIRQPDGIHYAFSGEDVLATYVLRRISATFHVALTATDPAVITGWS